MAHRVTVHAAVEFGRTGWGGIASALDLLTAAAVRSGAPTVVLAIGRYDRVLPVAGQVRVCTVAMPELAGGSLYRSPRRLELGRLAGRRMAGALRQLVPGDEVDLFVHNEELGTLFDQVTARRRIFVSHGLASQEHPDRPDLAEQERGALGRAQTVVAVSAAQAAALRLAHPDLPDVRHLPLPLELLADRLPARRPADRDGRLIVAAGRAVPQKGFDLLLAAAGRGLDGSTRTVVHLGHGDPGYQRRCRELAARAGPLVTVQPWLPRADLLDQMRRASVVCVPSRFEPLGLVAAEAQALGVPVVASDVGGLVELVGDRSVGRLVPVSGPLSGPAPGELAGCLSEAVGDPTPVTAGPDRLRRWSVAGHLAALERLREA